MILTFSSDGSYSADMHPFYTYPWSDTYTGYDIFFTLGKPVKINYIDMSLKCRNPTYHIWSEFVVRPGVGVGDSEAFDLIKTYWNSPRTLYDKLYSLDERRHLHKFFSLSYYNPAKPIIEFKPHVDVNHRGVIFHFWCDVRGSNNIERVDVTLDVDACFKPDIMISVRKRYLRLGERFKMSVIARNIGDCPGHALIEAREFRVEDWINVAKSVIKNFEWDFFEKERVRIPGRGRRSVQYPNPTTRREFPAFKWELVDEEAVDVEGVRFLWVNPTEMLLKGDMPGGETINYSGIIAGRGIKAEGVTTIEKLAPYSPFAGILITRPAIRVKGTLNPMEKDRIMYDELFYCDLQFDKELTVVENDQLKSASTTSYKYSKWTMPLAQIRSIRQKLKIKPLLEKPLIGLGR